MGNLVSIFTKSKLKEKVCLWLANKFDGVRVFTSGLDSGSSGAGVLIVMNSSLAKHVCKVFEVSGRLLSIKLLFRNKLSVSILGIYAGASAVTQFFQAGEINSLIAKTVNESFFVILGGDFNKNGSHRCASFKKCSDLGLVNSLGGSFFVKTLTWCNFRGITKTIDYVFVSSNLVGAVVDRGVDGVEKYFDIDHKAVYVSVGLDGLLNVQLNSMHKQANRDYEFVVAKQFSNLDAMWNIVCKVVVLSAGETFKKKWFKGYDSVFNKISSRFHRLELLVSKLVRDSCLVSGGNFASLLETWDKLDSSGALEVKSLFLSGSGFNHICSVLAKARKLYHASKLLESRRAEDSSIKQAINKRIESFEPDKDHTIRSVLECPFHKVVLDHLVVEDELVLEPESVKLKVDEIMEGWIRKHQVIDDVSDNWRLQYWPLEYVFDGAFSGVMCLIEHDEFFGVVSDFPDSKVAGLSDILNELWKHCDSTFDMLQGDNFLVLKGTSIQSPIFAVGSVVEDALEKNRELWLVLQDMRKVYDSVGWEHFEKSLVKVKMCSKFIRFFSGIYGDRIN
ncbi:hypothetical protein G9A89_015234 [Geosiphon pyriformis]|nr:hypothetical protein G9A89_015234 [Geosiphon pyriformis]